MESNLYFSQKEENIASFCVIKVVKSTKITIGWPATFQRPTLIRNPSWAALSRQDLNKRGSSINSGFCSVYLHTSGPIKIWLLLYSFTIFNAFVEITVCIPPTLLQTSQLTSNK